MFATVNRVTHSSTRSSHHTLRERTAAAHARIDEIVGHGLRDVGAYRAYLRGMHGFIAISERALSASACDLSLPRTWLESDLAALDAVALPPPRAPTRIEQDGAAQLGWEYVVSGASVGARYLLRGAQALGCSAEHGARFLAGHSAVQVWPEFLGRLDRAALPAAPLERACTAALSAFAVAEQAFRSAHVAATDPPTAQADAVERVAYQAAYPGGRP